jgi:hypothetical protein
LDASDAASNLAVQTVPAFRGVMQFQSLFGPHSIPLPRGFVEIVVTQQPLASPEQLFSAPGLSLGGQQTWSYVWDFRGLTNFDQ